MWITLGMAVFQNARCYFVKHLLPMVLWGLTLVLYSFFLFFLLIISTVALAYFALVSNIKGD